MEKKKKDITATSEWKSGSPEKSCTDAAQLALSSTIFYYPDMPEPSVSGKSKSAGRHRSITLVEHIKINLYLRKQRKSLEEAVLLLLILNKEELVEKTRRCQFESGNDTQR